MSITAKMVQELRERTGAGMMDCKKALVASNGDIEGAIEAMRKSGQAKAAKKAGRIAAEGLIIILKSSDNKKAVILEINCETDFVARDDNFVNFSNQLAKLALENNIGDLESLLALTYSDGVSVEQMREQLINKIGENINIRRVSLVSTDGVLGSYIHSGRIGVLVQLESGDESIAKDLAMHIAANNPIVVSPNDVPESLVSKEKEIFTAQAQESGKPPEIIEKMIGGRIKKYLAEVSLLGQPFVKDPNVSVEKYLNQQNAKVTHFMRFEVGEGIEKKTEDFASEVMAQVRGE